MKLKILTQPDKLLFDNSYSVSSAELESKEFKDQLINLVDTMKDWDQNFAHSGEHAVAIAASQVGWMKAVTLLRIGAGLELENFAQTGYGVLINPKITAISSKLLHDAEGCLSVPGFYAYINRPEWVRVKFLDNSGNLHQRKFKGFPSRIIQHEIDHMQGRLFYQLLTEEKDLREFNSKGDLIKTNLSLDKLLSKHAKA